MLEADGASARHVRYPRRHLLFAMIEPLRGKGCKLVPADLATQLKNFTLADPRRTDHGQKVALPLVRNSYPQLTHADDVGDVFVVLLHFHGRKDQGAFSIDVCGRAHVGRWQSVAAIGLMRLRQHRVAMNAVIVDDRHQDGVIGGMRIAVIGRIVKEGVAALELRMKLFHCPRHHVRADQDVDGQAIGGREQLAVVR